MDARRLINPVLVFLMGGFMFIRCGKNAVTDPAGKPRIVQRDLAAVEVIGPPNAALHRSDTWQVSVRNEGANTVSNYTVRLFKEGGIELAAVNARASLDSGETALFDFAWTPVLLEETFLYGEVLLTDDEIPGNNMTPFWDVYTFPQGESQYLIWDNDHSATYINPDNGDTTDCEYGLMQALDTSGVKYHTVAVLPKILHNYDIVFVELGIYCGGST